MPLPKQSDAGSVAVEFALIGGAVIFLIGGVVEFSWQYWVRNSLDYAITEAARCKTIKLVDVGSGTNCTTTDGLTSFFKAKTPGVPYPGSGFALAATYPGTATPLPDTDRCTSYSYAAAWLLGDVTGVAPPTYSGWACYYF
jgi:hypothetical protein